METSKEKNRQLIPASLEVAFIVLLCFLYAGSPPPGKNEPHYLGKAKNYWQPEWCEGDFFYESADAHELFFWTFGWVTNYCSLSTSAWIGRFLVWFLFALGWRSFIRALVTTCQQEAMPLPTTPHTTRTPWSLRFAGLCSFVLLIPLIHFGHLAGEWLIGGIEAKGFAYPLVFLAMGQAVQGRWKWVWPLLGLASCFHVLIGGWAVIAHLIAWWLRREQDQLRFAQILPWLILGGVLALPGLVPAISLKGDATPEQVAEANITYSFRRLSHHLVFYRFHWLRILSFVITTVAWWRLRRYANTKSLKRLDAIVVGSLCIAAGGFWLDILLAPLNSVRAAVMRFYWFRLSDIFVPVGISAGLVGSVASQTRIAKEELSQTMQKTTLPRGVAFSALLLGLIGFAFAMQSDGFGARASSLQQQNWRLSKLDESDPSELAVIDDAWLDACRWVRDNDLPPGSLFLTPTRQQTFKWYAHRPDLVTWKDIPQDAASIAHWWVRRGEVYQLGDWPWTNPEQLANIVATYRVTHVVWPHSVSYASRYPVPDEVEKLYQNDVFVVYQLP